MVNPFKLFLVLSLSCSLATADDNAVWLERGQVAPYEGLLLKEQKAQDVRIRLLERDSFLRQIELHQKNEDIYKQQNKLLTEQNNDLAKSLNDERSSTTWGRIGLILTGVLLTVGAGIALRQASR